MKNQTAAAIATLAQTVNWEKVDLQSIIEAGNQGLLGKPLTEWLSSKSWVSGTSILTPIIWTIDDYDNIHFTVVSNGMTGEQWEKYFKNRGFRISDDAHNVLCRVSEAPTDGVIYNVIVRPGKKWNNKECITKNILAYAMEKGWKTPHWEVACLIRDAFTDEQLEQMGLWYIATMHELVFNSNGDPDFLYSGRDGDGCWLGADSDLINYDLLLNNGWRNDGGFAFVVSSISSQAMTDKQVCPKV